MDAVSRRKTLHRMGLCGPLPTVETQRAWALIDDRIPPAGDADGEFTSFIQWVNKASSWIGFTGAKCFDTLDRPCRNGGDFMRARDEDTFPVRWYWPDRFDPPKPEISKPAMAVLLQLQKAENYYLTANQIHSATGKSKVRNSVLAALENAGFISAKNDGYALSLFGQDELPFEIMRQERASYAKRY